ncbi:hypothetical protein HW555_008782 [Spodoptera exigua]|uniref:Uncharacterized protein n=1 Tax=Spodoptera exigua TaxID=7107 RepID=A0A835GE81_SPOEX|nr:hypothetical protein HW555_008782 [Spodoptera exigua]
MAEFLFTVCPGACMELGQFPDRSLRVRPIYRLEPVVVLVPGSYEVLQHHHFFIELDSTSVVLGHV